MGQANFPVLGPLKPQKHMIWCTYIGKTFGQVWTDHKLVNTTQKLQIGVMVTEKSFWDKKLPLFVESLICMTIRRCFTYRDDVRGTLTFDLKVK